MNPVCVINTVIPYLAAGESCAGELQGARYIEVVRDAISQGASVVDLGAVAEALGNASSIRELSQVLSEVRSSDPEALLQLGVRSLFELYPLVENFDALRPDIVSIPLALLRDEQAVPCLRNLHDELKPFATRIVLDVDDLSMVYRAVAVHDEGLLNGRLRLDMSFGRKSGIPPDREAFAFFVQTLRRLAPDANWWGVGYSRSELELARWSIEMGGHCKASGLVSGARDQATLSKVIRLCKEYGRRPASFKEARHVLSLEDSQSVSVV